MFDVIFEFAEIRLLPILLKLLLSMLIGGTLGLERGRKRRAAGFRTHMLVCMGATVVMLTSEFMTARYGVGDGMRLGAQVISGIGFLGAGTIMVTGHDHIKGLTTAASLWVAACMGIAVGVGFYEGAILGFILVLLILAFFGKIENLVYREIGRLELYIELDNSESIGQLVDLANDEGLTVLSLELARKNQDKSVSVHMKVRKEGKDNQTIIALLSNSPGIRSIEEY